MDRVAGECLVPRLVTRVVVAEWERRLDPWDEWIGCQSYATTAPRPVATVAGVWQYVLTLSASRLNRDDLATTKIMASAAIQNTLALLEERLRTIQHIIHGSSQPSNAPPSTDTSPASRLHAIERQLGSLAARSATVSDVLALQKAHPSLFHPSASPTDNEAASLLPTGALAELVLAHSPLYTSTASQLTALQSTPLSDSDGLTKLVEVMPRIEKARAKQEAQTREVAELRARSARVVEEWYESGVLEMGDKWAEWEERVRDCEILVRRKEAVKRRIEEGVI
nr:hypothetical protein CFP56_36149 [Quercus suber]